MESGAAAWPSPALKIDANRIEAVFVGKARLKPISSGEEHLLTSASTDRRLAFSGQGAGVLPLGGPRDNSQAGGYMLNQAVGARNPSGYQPLAQRRIASAEMSISSSLVDQFEIEIRIACIPCHVVPPNQHVPSS